MATLSPQNRPDRADVYQRVTDRIVAAIEAGNVPWRSHFAAGAAGGIDRPSNACTGAPYHGINVLLLMAAAMADNRTDGRWLTYRQAQQLGGHVREGEHGEQVVFADSVVLRAERETAEAEGRKAEPIYFLKSYTVFNLSQCDGLPAKLAPAPTVPADPCEAADRLIRACGARICHGTARAAYSPDTDTVLLPLPGACASPADYYSVAMHELAHWTGPRLGREMIPDHTSDAYAREELVAEIAASFVCAALGLPPLETQVGYLAHYVRLMRADSHAITRAAAAAQRAADYLLAFAAEQSADIELPEAA